MAAYTWGKSIDTLSATEANDAFPNGIFNQLFFDQRTTRGLSDFNVAQTVVLSATWEIPGPRKGSRLPEWAFGGWQLVALYKASTGQPFTPILGGDPVGTKLDETGLVPSFVPGCNPVNANFKKDANGPIYLNPSCFILPQSTPAIAAECQPYGQGPGNAGIAGTCANLRGNMGRNLVIGPGLSKLDFSVFKNNYVRRISESFNAQFRAEIFNIFNRANFGSPNRQHGGLRPKWTVDSKRWTPGLHTDHVPPDSVRAEINLVSSTGTLACATFTRSATVFLHETRGPEIRTLPDSRL